MGATEHTVWEICLKGNWVTRADLGGKVLLMMIRLIYQGDKKPANSAYFDFPAGPS